MRAFEATTEIRAPAERAWEILSYRTRYPECDSGVTRVDGRVADGEPITVHSEVSPGRAIPDLGPSFRRFADGLKAHAETG